MLKKVRDERVDILRCIALIGIVIAHSQPGAILFQLRNFDVILMVLLLGTSYYLSNSGKSISYIGYLRKRFMRLVVPVWAFLSLFFILFYVVSLLLGDAYYFGLKDIVSSYLLMDGIDYVWILRVFVLIAVISPLLLYTSQRIRNNRLYMVLLVGLYAIYTFFILVGNVLPDVNMVHKVYQDFFLYTFGYGLVAAIGIRLKLLSNREISIFAALSSLVCIGLAFYHGFTPTQDFKYPPTLYYLSYGLAISFVLYLMLQWSPLYQVLSNRFVKFLSRTSLWLYFWHIIPIKLIEIFGDELSFVSRSFPARFTFILGMALFLTYSQERIQGYYREKRASSQQPNTASQIAS